MKSSGAHAGKPISLIVGQQPNKPLCNRSARFPFDPASESLATIR